MLHTYWAIPLVFFLGSCGNNNENLNFSMKTAKPQTSTEPDVKSLGLRTQAGKAFASSIGGQKANIDKALRSMVVYQNGLNRRCTGVMVDDDSNGTTLKTYFYTAWHCFQNRNPLGMYVESEFTINNPRSYVSPWLAENGFERSISTQNAEIFRMRYARRRGSDVIRFLQREVPLGQSTKENLTLCQISDSNGLQAVSYTGVRDTENQGVVWADFPFAADLAPLPTPYATLLMETSSRFRRAIGVQVSPGDSGAPVFAVKHPMVGNKVGDGVDSYQCVHGIITREFWINQGCSRGSCRLKGEAIFERLLETGVTASTANGNWEPLTP